MEQTKTPNKEKKNRTQLVFIAAIALAAIACAAVLFLRGGQSGSRGTVNIYLADDLYASYPVAVPKKITIDQGDGRVNVITIDGSGVSMESSTCPTQTCVQSGRLSADMEEDVFGLGNWIICLPNRVSIELTGDAEE